ncbi:hypothetical protein Bca4012_020003 [Brassica carinata]
MRQKQGDLVVEELDAEMNHGGDELGQNGDLTTTTMEERRKTARRLFSVETWVLDSVREQNESKLKYLRSEFPYKSSCP